MSAVTTDQLPILPETEIIEPIAQCGVLYLGTVPPSPGRRGLDSVQEPLSHRYPVDGTNTARGNESFFFYQNILSNLISKVLIQFFPYMIMVFS